MATTCRQHRNHQKLDPLLKSNSCLMNPETVTTIQTGYVLLYNVACLGEKEIWTRGNERTMKLYSINQGSPIKTVNIVENEKIEKVIRLQNWRPSGVCSTSSGDLQVIMKQTIEFEDKAEPLYSSGFYNRYITENRNLDICVTDCIASPVMVVNQAGKLRFRYTGHTPASKNKPFNPLGITTDSQRHILIAGNNNDYVQIIVQDGQFLRYILAVYGLSYPWGLCRDTNNNLFVAQWGNRQVKKIKYMYC
ncbi:uncharacterized protein LOC133178256 [Saccostrea echinata]|uniref:uncharacterized protein LOC133178256 n=1 Tax=Saccostrea echinata TaxID=191078 RepID=UPI002A7FED76|nr:uncharacterized protein LOC133178256 [Saccostrea echinata]